MTSTGQAGLLTLHAVDGASDPGFDSMIARSGQIGMSQGFMKNVPVRLTKRPHARGYKPFSIG